MKTRYAIQILNSGRDGELLFLCHCQEYWSKNLEKTKEDLQDRIEEDKIEDIDDFNYRIIKLTIEEA